MPTQINPTRMELTRLKKRLKTAARGHKLLKDKRDEMVRRFIEIIKRNKELREQVEQKLSAAMGRFAVARAEMGNAAVEEALIYPVRTAELETGLKNIMSVDVPTIKLKPDGNESLELPYGFAFTSSELDGAVLDLAALLPLLIELAEVEKSCNMLADEIEKTRRRVNALEHVMIPEMEQQIKYITMKLEENERGTKIRLMKVKEMLQKAE
ncbi:MAG: V-type ATP synthase subunit D [Ruminococcaceae bacterium]|nr:V-type ATP synthase subunit D [Oscillospiraceae bacterium]